MNQSLSIYNIRQKLHDIMKNTDSNTAQALSEVDASLGDFLDYGIDFKRVVDGLDDSLLITDNTGNVSMLIRHIQKTPVFSRKKY